MTPNFRRISNEVYAEQFSPDRPLSCVHFSAEENVHYIFGVYRAHPVRYGVAEGDWILTKKDGTRQVVPPDAFAELYEPIPEPNQTA